MDYNDFYINGQEVSGWDLRYEICVHNLMLAPAVNASNSMDTSLISAIRVILCVGMLEIGMLSNETVLR